jgi:toxin FitB
MIVLDTNVLSALMRQVPDAKAVAWLDGQSRTSVWTTSITILEIRFGLQLERRIAAFDEEAADQAADLMSVRQRKGRTVELRDTMIAGIVLARHATLATRNLAHFEDLSVPIINPWTA